MGGPDFVVEGSTGKEGGDDGRLDRGFDGGECRGGWKKAEEGGGKELHLIYIVGRPVSIYFEYYNGKQRFRIQYKEHTMEPSEHKFTQAVRLVNQRKKSSCSIANPRSIK